jgi:hypothetical protein
VNVDPARAITTAIDYGIRFLFAATIVSCVSVHSVAESLTAPATPYLGGLSLVLHEQLAAETAALHRERELCTGGRYRFDPMLLLRAQQQGWGTGPVPQRLLYYCPPGQVDLVVVSDRPEQLETLAAAGRIPAKESAHGRLQLKDRLVGWVMRAIYEAVGGRDAFIADHLPERWAQALVAHYTGLVVLCPVALEKYRTRLPVAAASAGLNGKTRNITPLLDTVRNAFRTEMPSLTAPDDRRGRHLLQAISRAIAAGLLHLGGADPRQAQRMLLSASSEYQIDAAVR